MWPTAPSQFILPSPPSTSDLSLHDPYRHVLPLHSLKSTPPPLCVQPSCNHCSFSQISSPYGHVKPPSSCTPPSPHLSGRSTLFPSAINYKKYCWKDAADDKLNASSVCRNRMARGQHWIDPTHITTTVAIAIAPSQPRFSISLFDETVYDVVNRSSPSGTTDSIFRRILDDCAKLLMNEQNPSPRIVKNWDDALPVSYPS